MLKSETRSQYPIGLAYTLTIHKNQGQNENERSLGLAFVALSRVKNYTDFITQPFPLDRLT